LILLVAATGFEPATLGYKPFQDDTRANDPQTTLLSSPVCERAERGRGVVWIHPDVTARVIHRATTEYGCKYGRPNRSGISRRDLGATKTETPAEDFVAQPRNSSRPARPYLASVIGPTQSFINVIGPRMSARETGDQSIGNEIRSQLPSLHLL
jgi:hypothetical protein